MCESERESVCVSEKESARAREKEERESRDVLGQELDHVPLYQARNVISTRCVQLVI